MKRDALDAKEEERRLVQATLDQRTTAAERNRRGQFATPPELAVEMALLAASLLPARGSVRLLDPGVGTGVFFYAARKALGAQWVRTAWGFEIDPEVAAAARQLWASDGLQVRSSDFCTAAPPGVEPEKATLVFCNPPYVRHHHLAPAQKVWLRREVKKLGVQVSGLAGLYCYFLLLAHRWLAGNGLGVWIVPAEFLDVNYGRALKEYLTTRVTLLRMHRFDPEDVQFTDALVSSVVVAFRNESPAGNHLVEFSSGGRLLNPRSVHPLALTGLDPTAKWGPLFSSSLPGGTANNGSLTIGDLFHVRRGLATGANEYFIVDRKHAEALGLPAAYLRPILPGPRYVPGSIIESAPDGFPQGLPERVLLDCDLPLGAIQERYPALADYLAAGEKNGVSSRYLPCHRKPWYRQEARPPAPILCTYMGRQTGGRALRFLRNQSRATAPNVYLLLYPRPHLARVLTNQPEVIDRIFEALLEISSQLTPGGRVYGGGLNKIEPRELEAVGFPNWLQEIGEGLLKGSGARSVQRLFSEWEPS